MDPQTYRDRLATILTVLGMVLIPAGSWLIGGTGWLILALGLESFVAGVIIGWE